MNTKHLKAKILDLAIRGKLVPQDSSEGNAADLLQKIRDEKYICHPELDSGPKKKIKADKNVSFIIKADDGRHYEQFADGTLKDIEYEIPFEIPENWYWCRLGTFISIKSGDFVKVGDNQEGEYPIYGGNGINGFTSNYNINEKTIIIGRVGFYCGSIHLTEGKAWITDNAFITNFDSSIFDINYLYHLLCKLDLRSKSNSTAQPVVSGRSIYPLLIPLPPLSEQQRIVSAIEKAFEQIDIIEKNKLNLKTYIKQTKCKVLDLAIHGKLVEQNPGKGNAFELLEKIRKEKSDFIKQKKLKEDKKSSFIIKAEDGKHYEQFADGSLKDIEDEIPFEEPKGWTWCRINEIAVDMADGPFGSNLKSEHYTTNKEARIIQLSNLSDEGWREENTRYTTIKHATENIFRSIVEPGNIVIAKMMPAGRAMICPDKEQMYVLSSDCVKLVPIEGVYKQFLVRALNSPFFRNRVVDNVQGVTRLRPVLVN